MQKTDINEKFKKKKKKHEESVFFCLVFFAINHKYEKQHTDHRQKIYK
jgi:hypothetical protein